MKTLCQPNNENVCSQCGRVVDPKKVVNCPAKKTERIAGKTIEKKASVQLGDMVEAFLSSHGITKEKYLDAKESIGLPRTCGCNYRQELLNRLGSKFHIDNALEKFNTWRKGQFRALGLLNHPSGNRESDAPQTVPASGPAEPNIRL